MIMNDPHDAFEVGELAFGPALRPKVDGRSLN